MTAENQLTSMAGEFLTVGKLFKKGYQASVTLGNAKSVDILVYNSKNDKNYNVQVKALRSKNNFNIKIERVNSSHIYVFVILNGKDDNEEFYIVPGHDITTKRDHFFGSSYKGTTDPIRPGINYGPLREYRDRWDLFDR